MKRLFLTAVVLIAIFACAGTQTRLQYLKETLPEFDSSTATQPLMVKVIARMLDIPEQQTEAEYPHTHTFEAYKKLINGDVDIILSMEPNKELIGMAKEQGVEFESVPIGRDAFVFIVNKNNPVSELSIQQIQDIYTGKITNWSELGGADIKIIPFQRQHESGSQAIMENMVMRGLTMIEPPQEMVSDGMGFMNERLSFDNSNSSIGYNIYYFTTFMAPNEEIKMLGLNGVYPNKETIKNETYPFTGNICAVIRKDEKKNSDVRKIIDWLKTEEGQAIVEAGGYVSIY